MPCEGGKRQEIGHVHPTGWHATCYDQSLVNGMSLYNRTHLIAWCLSDEADNPRNLITGTQHLNQRAMQPLENRVCEYIRHSGNHVLYRVTPVFHGDELVARGVQMEARSVEDGGAGVSFNVYCHNVQPGVAIDYATGESHRAPRLSRTALPPKGYLLGDSVALLGAPDEPGMLPPAPAYALNFSTQRFHLVGCGSVDDIGPRNKGACSLSRDELVTLGYAPCGHCRP